MQAENWNDLRYLLALQRGGNLAAAAKQLGVDGTTISRRLTALQQSIGSTLVQRSGRIAMQLTAEGKLVARYAEQIELQLQQMAEQLGHHSEQCIGVVRLTSVPILVNHVLASGFSDLLAEHPQLQIELIPDSRNLSLIDREVDLAIRLARPITGGSAIKVKKLARLSYSVYVSSQFASRQASRLPWIVFDEALSHLPVDKWMRQTAARSGQSIASLRVHDAETALQAVLAGTGKTALPDLIAGCDKRLRRLKPDGLSTVPTRDVWLVAQSDQSQLRRVRAVIERVTELFN